MTAPTAVLLPTSSNATTLCTTVDMKNARCANMVPIQRTRKSRSRNDANVVSSQDKAGQDTR